jgi:transcriptional regulator with XRE-family HTH domain
MEEISMVNLKFFRKKKGYTQKTLAEKTGISRSYLCEIEHGYKQPTLQTLNKLATALDIPLTALIEKETFQHTTSKDKFNIGETESGNHRQL